MWDSAFLISTQRVTDALLRKPVLPTGGKAFEKISAAIAVRMALRARPSIEQSLLFIVPEATSSTARQIVAALLVGNYAHSKGDGQLPPEEVRPLFKGDILLVTPAVSVCKGELEELRIGVYDRLKDFWEVLPLSKYAKPQSDKPRVFLANPGWMPAGTAGRRFSVAVIDASHPRTYDRLPDLLRVAAGCTALRLVVAPPMDDAALRACGWPERTSIWVWDPQAMTDAQDVVERKDDEPHELCERFLWVCDDDVETGQALAQFRGQLVAAARAAAGKPYPGLQLCWSIYNRLRQLTVPLAQLEQATSSTWAGSLRERLDALDNFQGHGDVAWDATWPGLVEAVKSAYQTLLKREETAKFWAIASGVEAFLASTDPHLRIVVASETEGELLRQALSRVVDGVDEAMVAGRLETITGAQEARLVAEGQRSPTILLGPRTNGHRYLDVFPSNRVDEFVYPYEVEVERAAQARLYGNWMQEANDDRRLQLLAPLGLRPSSKAKARPAVARPRMHIGSTSGHAVKVATDAHMSAGLDIDALIADLEWDGVHEENLPQGHGGMPAQTGDAVEVTFASGDIQRYYASQSVDVFFAESGAVRRHPVASLQPGWQVIAFVDVRYDSLFNRLTEVVSSRLSVRERVALNLWQAAKDALIGRYRYKSELYERLREKGLKSTYEAFMSWFNGEDGIVAPQQFDEFEIVARECETYSKAPAMLASTFEAVQHERGRNRAAGKVLRRFLRAVVSGDDYDDALDSARKLDTALGDVLAAVEVLTVHSVRVIQRSS
ncbi:DISARM anti-phage system protein DrmE domain-containing protein [Burkholderia ubonensis]|uniref:DISARM anti-phage system protein DrmE domain-containing protein n=1 Tax=Burkholderia ubonensis TaxID=101571 RepID=UPI000F57B5D0|nr:hypothetical protein [Burkholderia ubonensis]RQP38380.1 hypothetical protein DF155_08795 [Burkholderia ubonensis]RQP38699.1 hypothetical protein DF154_16570 [Burkholderia ubonensis]RQP42836.1 hypothetical protein DF156_11735 [Burkholderia ubonensis]RQP57228.1 hypothetical protein DF144_09340 [Burkholderia ubonensis]RQP62150.1 hypothetical protein DF159_14165 [Burkholderia ubonensis]